MEEKTCTLRVAIPATSPSRVLVFEKTSDEHDEAAGYIFEAPQAADGLREPPAHFNHACHNLLARPLLQSEYEPFCQNQRELDETNHLNYKARVLSMYKQNPHLFSHVTATTAVDTSANDADNADGNDPKRSFKGHCVDCIDWGIPHGYRTTIITHPKVKGASAAKAILRYTLFNEKESLAEYVERIGEDALVEIGIKMTDSVKTIKAQSFTINGLKNGLPESRTLQFFKPQAGRQCDVIYLQWVCKTSSHLNIIQDNINSNKLFYFT
jgi:hypothetical protein